MGEYLSIRDLRPEIGKSFLVRFHKRRKKLTVADRIRAMTDEELANLLQPTCPVGKCPGKSPHDCFNCWLDYLKQEVI